MFTVEDLLNSGHKKSRLGMSSIFSGPVFGLLQYFNVIFKMIFFGQLFLLPSKNLSLDERPEKKTKFYHIQRITHGELYSQGKKKLHWC
jgi:hypothetical protein